MSPFPPLRSLLLSGGAEAVCWELGEEGCGHLDMVSTREHRGAVVEIRVSTMGSLGFGAEGKGALVVG